jgi:hypothetical protein
LLQTDRTTGNRRGLPDLIDYPARRALPLAGVVGIQSLPPGRAGGKPCPGVNEARGWGDGSEPQAFAPSLTRPAEQSLFGGAFFFPNPESSFRSFSPRNSNRDAGPDSFSSEPPLLSFDIFPVGYLPAYTHKYPIPPIKRAVIVVAAKLERNLTNPVRKSVGRL